MKRVEIVAYCGEDCDDDIDRAVEFLRKVAAPHLVIVGKTDITDKRLAEIMRQGEDGVVPD